VLIGLILILVSWAAASIELSADRAGTSYPPQQEWRRTSRGWMPRQTWTEESEFTGAVIDPLTVALFESLLAVFAIVALTETRSEAS